MNGPKDQRRYLFYSVAHYVHDRREERLNVGVVVYDPVEKIFTSRFSSSQATRRIKDLYPEVDRAGLQLYLDDLGRTLPHDHRVQDSLREGNPLDVLEAEWRNVIRFTPARSYPAINVRQAVSELMTRFVDEPRARPDIQRSYGGVERARRRTMEAITRVLELPLGEMGVGSFHAVRPVFTGGREFGIPINFPFLVYEEYLIDTLSLEGPGTAEPTRQADHFIRKVENLRKYDRTLQPHAAVSIDPQRRDQGLSLIDYMRMETNLGSEDVVEADEAEVIVQAIRRKRLTDDPDQAAA